AQREMAMATPRAGTPHLRRMRTRRSCRASSGSVLTRLPERARQYRCQKRDAHNLSAMQGRRSTWAALSFKFAHRLHRTLTTNHERRKSGGQPNEAKKPDHEGG